MVGEREQSEPVLFNRMRALKAEACLICVCIPHSLALAGHMGSLSVVGLRRLGLHDPNEHVRQSMLCTGCHKGPGK